MAEVRKNLIPVISDEEVLKVLKELNENDADSIVKGLKTQIHLLADIRVFLRKIYKKLPSQTDTQVLTKE